MVDIDAAIGYVIAHGDPVERARLAFIRNGAPPPPHIVERIAAGQTFDGGWPATGDSEIASVDATCFRLGEVDDLGGLRGPAVERALTWLATSQRRDGSWQENESLAPEAPVWAMPGDPEATFYLTSVAGYWLTVASVESRPSWDSPYEHATTLNSAARFAVSQLRPDGTWPSFLAAGWHLAGLLHGEQFFYESARVQLVLGDRLGDMTPADVAAMGAALSRLNLGDEQLMEGIRKRLGESQRTDGGWDSDEGPTFDVNTTLMAIRACR